MDIVANLIKFGNTRKESTKISNDLKKEGLRICDCYEPIKVQLYNGVDEIAEMIGAKVEQIDRGDYKERSFTLDGVIYMQVSSSITGEFTKLEGRSGNEDNK